jgi:hypothetical protein
MQMWGLPASNARLWRHVYVEKDLTKAAYYHWRLMRAIDLKALSKDLRR